MAHFFWVFAVFGGYLLTRSEESGQSSTDGSDFRRCFYGFHGAAQTEKSAARNPKPPKFSVAIGALSLPKGPENHGARTAGRSCAGAGAVFWDRPMAGLAELACRPAIYRRARRARLACPTFDRKGCEHLTDVASQVEAVPPRAKPQASAIPEAPAPGGSGSVQLELPTTGLGRWYRTHLDPTGAAQGVVPRGACQHPCHSASHLCHRRHVRANPFTPCLVQP